jgi:hypothetical protein
VKKGLKQAGRFARSTLAQKYAIVRFRQVSQSRYLNIACYRRSEFKSALIKSDSRGLSDVTKPMPEHHIILEMSAKARSLQDPKMQSKIEQRSKFKLRVHGSSFINNAKHSLNPVDYRSLALS